MGNWKKEVKTVTHKMSISKEKVLKVTQPKKSFLFTCNSAKQVQHTIWFTEWWKLQVLANLGFLNKFASNFREFYLETKKCKFSRFSLTFFNYHTFPRFSLSCRKLKIMSCSKFNKIFLLWTWPTFFRWPNILRTSKNISSLIWRPFRIVPSWEIEVIC